MVFNVCFSVYSTDLIQGPVYVQCEIFAILTPSTLRHFDTSTPGPSSHVSQADPTRCSRISEGPLVNVDVTSPGATIALGFMFMKSNNAAVAGRLEVPTTHFLLDYVRPDFLLLRVMCRGLVLWDSVRLLNISVYIQSMFSGKFSLH